MEIFDGKNSKKIRFLDDERKKLWERVLQLEKQVAEKPSDIEKEAKQASKKAAEYRNKAEERLEQANLIHSQISDIEMQIDNKLNSIITMHTEAEDSSKDILTNSAKLSSILGEINQVLDNHPEIETEIDELDSLIAKVEENSSKANTTYKSILSRKTEIDELHREILGYKDIDEDGEVTSVEGLKSELESTYKRLDESATVLENKIEDLDEISKTQYDTFIKKNENDLHALRINSKSEYDKINNQIESLLPNALTAGLSSAFIKKKDEEEQLYNEHKKNFSRGILYLSLAAFLPITISVFYLLSGATLTDTLERAPKIMLAFLPLYIPLLWVTISANKKVNLSKRLIEEYSHKQVLSMTIEGLSKQIENIEDSDLSEELRIKLLNNFLDVSNENPGKLISDYQKSDNPFLNIMDRDNKERKEKTIVQTLEDSAKDIIEKTTDEIEEVITKR